MNRQELDALPVGTVVETAGFKSARGVEYVKDVRGLWRHDNWRPVSTARLLDPEHSRQPIRQAEK